MGCQHLIQSADRYIQHFFCKVSLSDEFLTLCFDDLVELVQRDELNVSSEENIFEACMKWVKYDDDARSVLL
jgi:kelch-like protein 18